MSKKGKIFPTPKLELLCGTGAQVDCISRKKLKMLGLGEGQLRKPQVSLDCANKTRGRGAPSSLPFEPIEENI